MRHLVFNILIALFICLPVLGYANAQPLNLLQPNVIEQEKPRNEFELQYLYALSNHKAACLAKLKETVVLESHFENAKAQQQLCECYKKIIINVAQQFYPGTHFGKDIEGAINAVVEQHHRLLYKMANCPVSKGGDCKFYEEYDVLTSTADYLNELIEFMVLNIGEGYPEFNPAAWLKRWDGASENS